MSTFYAIKPRCEYARWNATSSWKAFYHEELYASGSGPSKTSQKLALWYPGQLDDWPYITLLNITEAQLVDHYHCTPEEAKEALEYIFKFILDVEARFV
jgi:hypothetical protein